MSWTATAPDIDKADIGDIVGQPQTNPVGVDDAYSDHLAAAKAAAVILAEAVGTGADHVTVTFSGHANPGHAPAEGWADEFIAISVSARPAK